MKGTRRWPRAAVLFLCGAAACGPADDGYDLVSVQLAEPPGLPAGTAAIELSTSRQGQTTTPPKTQVLSDLAALRFGVRVPADWSGALAVGVKALSAGGCALASATRIAALQTAPELTMALAPTAQSGCALRLQVAGTGRIVIQPGGGVCERDCDLRVAPDESFLLSAEGPGFMGWSGDCAGSLPLCLLPARDTPQRSVTAIF